MGAPPIRAEAILRIQELARAGMGVKQIAREVGHHRNTVRRHALHVLKRSHAFVDVQRIRALAASGKSSAYIACLLECGENTVDQYTADIRADRKRKRMLRLLRDYERSEPGEKQELAGRFNYASAASMQVAIHQIRKRLKTAAGRPDFSIDRAA